MSTQKKTFTRREMVAQLLAMDSQILHGSDVFKQAAEMIADHTFENPKLAPVLREYAEQIQNETIDQERSRMDTSELIRVLARIVEGKSIYRAFGAPGDWGYSHPIGKALSGR